MARKNALNALGEKERKLVLPTGRKDVCIFRVDGGEGIIRVMRHECETYDGVLFLVSFKRRRAYGGRYEKASDAVRKAYKMAESYCCQTCKNNEWV